MLLAEVQCDLLKKEESHVTPESVLGIKMVSQA